MRVGDGPNWGNRTLIGETLSRTQASLLDFLCCGQLIVKAWDKVRVGYVQGLPSLLDSWFIAGRE